MNRILHTITRHEREVVSTFAVVGLKRWNQWALRVVGCTLAEQFLSNTISCDPDMVLACEIGLIDGTELLSPLMEFEKTVLVWHVWHTAEYGIT